MYSLVNVATVVRDLARHPRAEQVATELLRAFALTSDDLEVLESTAYDDPVAATRRSEVLAADRMRPRALQVLAAARGFADDLGIDAYAAAVDVLETAPIGDLDDLQAFVRREVLVDAWNSVGDVAVAVRPRALDIAADGVIGAYADDPLLRRRWDAFVAAQGIEPAPTPWLHVVEVVGALERDAPVQPAPADWASMMHEACWAVHLTGRERAAAVTQLHALRALARVWAPDPPSLRAVAMTAAAVHAAVAADVLDAATRRAMSQPLFSASSGAVS